jgi:hypothetical protein
MWKDGKRRSLYFLFSYADPHPDLIRIRIQEGKYDPQKEKKFTNLIFLSAGCSHLRAAGFSCPFGRPWGSKL